MGYILHGQVDFDNRIMYANHVRRWYFINDANVASQSTSKDFTGANPHDTVIQLGPSGTPISGEVVGSTVATGNVVYAGFFHRFIATLIDGVLVAVGSGIISGIFGLMGDAGRTLASLVTMVLGYAYYVYFISHRGQTLGKQAIGIRVQNIETGQNLDMVSAILREVVGKFISALVLCLGYFWMLWDDKKQTWHDKIARSVVVKVK